MRNALKMPLTPLEMVRVRVMAVMMTRSGLLLKLSDAVSKKSMMKVYSSVGRYWAIVSSSLVVSIERKARIWKKMISMGTSAIIKLNAKTSGIA